MNDITRIRLAKTPYNIDLSAKKELEKYTRDIKQSLGDDVDVYDDIEIRMTEILAERGINTDDVITSDDVSAVRAQLGEPNDFADNETGSSQKDKGIPEQSDDEKFKYFNVAKHYYRDEDNAILGGVIAGLAAFTGWDVTLLRLIVVVLGFMSLGWVVIAYIAVWIVAPAARTASEKLEMRGQPVTISSIKQSARQFEEQANAAAERVSVKANEVGQRVSDKVQGLKDSTTRRSVGQNLLKIIAIFVGAIILVSTVFATMTGLLFGIAALIAATSSHATEVTIIVGLALAAGVSFAICLIIASIALISCRLTKRASRGIIIAIVASIILAFASCTVGTFWVMTGSEQGVKDTLNQVEQKYNNSFLVKIL